MPTKCTPQELIESNVNETLRYQAKIAALLSHQNSLCKLMEKWAIRKPADSSYSTRTVHKIDGVLKIHWSFEDHYGNMKERAEADLFREHISATLMGDEVLFSRFITQYRTRITCQLEADRRVLDTLKAKGLELIRALHAQE